ncbi:MAG: hypothetical protein WD010_03080 [Nitriliruptor sp.]|uniref:hypothetical protein n=1 Tax=Nitriliruptor sp. TaxID=2448056 RepID=UPI0034A04C0E
MNTFADEDGNGPLTSVFGITIFLGFMLFAVQVLLHLYGTSTVSAAAFDGARLMAADGGISCPAAASHVRGILGEYGGKVDVDCPVSNGEVVEVRVVGPSPAPLVGGFLRNFDLGDIERTARVRVEVFRPGGP